MVGINAIWAWGRRGADVASETQKRPHPESQQPGMPPSIELPGMEALGGLDPTLFGGTPPCLFCSIRQILTEKQVRKKNHSKLKL